MRKKNLPGLSKCKTTPVRRLISAGMEGGKGRKEKSTNLIY